MRVAIPARSRVMLLAYFLALAAAPACATTYKCIDHRRTIYSNEICGPDAQVVEDKTGIMPAMDIPKEPDVLPAAFDDPTQDPVLRNPVVGPAMKVPALDLGTGGGLLPRLNLMDAGNMMWLSLMGVPLLAGVLMLLIKKIARAQRKG